MKPTSVKMVSVLKGFRVNNPFRLIESLMLLYALLLEIKLVKIMTSKIFNRCTYSDILILFRFTNHDSYVKTVVFLWMRIPLKTRLGL